MDETGSTLFLTDGLLVVDAAGVVTKANSKMAALLHAKRRTLVGAALVEIDDGPWGAGVLADAVSSAKAAGAANDVVRRLDCRVDGRPRHLRLNAHWNGASTRLLVQDAEVDAGLERVVGASVAEQLRAEGLQAWKPTRVLMALVGVVPADFSAFAERLPPDVLCEFLSDHAGLVVQAAQSARAAAIKLALPRILVGFVGEDRVARAAATAVRIAEAGRALAREAALADIGSVSLKLAVDAGYVVVGPVGTQERIEHAMLGHRVDIVLGMLEWPVANTILMTDAARADLADPPAPGHRLLPMGPQRLPGIDHAVSLSMLVPG